jgi:hypothetical protein
MHSSGIERLMRLNARLATEGFAEVWLRIALTRLTAAMHFVLRRLAQKWKSSSV